MTVATVVNQMTCAQCGRVGVRGFTPLRWGWLSRVPKEWRCASRSACLRRRFGRVP